MNNEFRADLHVHSRCSDGTDSPQKLLELAVGAGLRGLSITDHDTIQAYTPELWSQAGALNIELLRGVEISSEWQGLTVHVLAYAFDDGIHVFLNEVLQRRIDRNRRILEKLKKKGICIDEAELHSSGPAQIVGRLHIATAMLEKKAVGTIQEAYDGYLKDDACCYASGGKFTPREVIEAVHAHRGRAILAHPHFLKKGHFLRDVLAHPFDGLECYYSRLTKDQETPWVKLAEKHHWLATGGSDYHGRHRPNIPLGASWVNEETFRKLSQR
ncbi:MAG: phosphoesterase [Parachlamydiales bacterium]|nr:phosphoesterase [Parachlamydiales bacterium]